MSEQTAQATRQINKALDEAYAEGLRQGRAEREELVRAANIFLDASRVWELDARSPERQAIMRGLIRTMELPLQSTTLAVTEAAEQRLRVALRPFETDKPAEPQEQSP